VEARSPRDIAEWLTGCRYVEDRHLHRAVDHWLHPCDFEELRRGDCEDFALWAWRKLVEGSYHAEFIVGVHHRSDGFVGRHAWVAFHEGGDEFVFDGVQRTVPMILRPRHEVLHEYVPQVGVGTSGRPFVFAGLFRTSWGRRMPLVPHDEG
jgi:hypothetical protein